MRNFHRRRADARNHRVFEVREAFQGRVKRKRKKEIVLVKNGSARNIPGGIVPRTVTRIGASGQASVVTSRLKNTKKTELPDSRTVTDVVSTRQKPATSICLRLCLPSTATPLRTFSSVTINSPRNSTNPFNFRQTTKKNANVFPVKKLDRSHRGAGKEQRKFLEQLSFRWGGKKENNFETKRNCLVSASDSVTPFRN